MSSSSPFARYGLAVLLGLAAAAVAWWVQHDRGLDTVTPPSAEPASPR